MARSEYNNGKSDNQCSDEKAGGGVNLPQGSYPSKPDSSIHGSAAERPTSMGSVPPATSPTGATPDEAPVTDLERRLQHRLALVDVRGGKSTEKSGASTPANDHGEQMGGDANAADAARKASEKSSAIPRTFEITEALDFANFAQTNDEPHGAKNADMGAKPSGPKGPNAPKHPPSSEAMKWDAIEGNLKAAPSVADVADNLKKLSPGCTDQQSIAGEPVREGRATAGFTLMSALEKLPQRPDGLNSRTNRATHTTASPSSSPSRPTPNTIQKSQPTEIMDSMDSMESGAEPFVANPSIPPTHSDGVAGSMDSMEYGMEPQSPQASIDNEMRSSRAQLDISLANLKAAPPSGGTRQASLSLGSNALTPGNNPPKGQMMVRMDLDNDPPPLSTHLNRAEPIPGDNRSMIIAGFLGGLSIAFIAIWGYIYTLPQSDQSLSRSNGQGRGMSSQDRSNLALKVDNVVWKSGKALPLNIKIGGDVSKSGLLVKLSGLPDDARLGNGFPTGDGAWIIPATKLEGLKLVLNHSPARTITIDVRLLEKDGNTETGHFSSFSVYPEIRGHLTAAPVHGIIAKKAGMAAIPMPRLMDGQTEIVKATPSQTTNGARGGSRVIDADDEAFGGLPEDFVLQENSGGGAVNSAMRQASRLALATPPARAMRSSPTSTMAEPDIRARSNEKTRGVNPGAGKRPISDAHRAFIREGNQHMRRGDIRKARGLYQRAYKGRAPEAALALGRSYDPIYLKRIANANEPADGAKAMKLYREAFTGGLETAQIKIDQLAKTMNKP